MESGVFTADIGTSSLKAAVITESGAVLAFTRSFFHQPVRADEWVKAFFSAWEQVVHRYAVRAICISGNGPTLAAIHHRQELSKPLRISDNTLLHETAAQLIQKAKEDRLFLWNEAAESEVFTHTSSLFLPRFTAYKRKYPEHFDAARLIVSGPEYLIYMLTGNAVTVLPDIRYKKAYWDAESCAEFGIPADKLAPFIPLGAEAGTFCGIPVIGGPPDFIAALLGTYTVAPGRACDRAGSSEGLNICVATQCSATGTLLLPSVITGLWNISCILPDSGTSFFQFISRYGYSAHDYRLCMEMINDEPFELNGSYPDTFGGQGRLFVEKLGFRLRAAIDRLEQAGNVHPVYTLSGGQARNPLWCQLKSDITGRTFALPHFADAELLGNAAVAFYALGDYRDLVTAAKRMHCIVEYYEPDPEAFVRYTEAYCLRLPH